MPDVDQLDPAVSERMGYCRTIRATVFEDRGRPIEMALFEPHDHWTEFGLAIHYDCDPDEPTQGSSEMSNYPTLQEALAAYAEEFARIEAEISPMPRP